MHNKKRPFLHLNVSVPGNGRRHPFESKAQRMLHGTKIMPISARLAKMSHVPCQCWNGRGLSGLRIAGGTIAQAIAPARCLRASCAVSLKHFGASTCRIGRPLKPMNAHYRIAARRRDRAGVLGSAFCCIDILSGATTQNGVISTIDKIGIYPPCSSAL